MHYLYIVRQSQMTSPKESQNSLGAVIPEHCWKPTVTGLVVGGTNANPAQMITQKRGNARKMRTTWRHLERIGSG